MMRLFQFLSLLYCSIVGKLLSVRGRLLSVVFADQTDPRSGTRIRSDKNFNNNTNQKAGNKFNNGFEGVDSAHENYSNGLGCGDGGDGRGGGGNNKDNKEHITCGTNGSAPIHNDSELELDSMIRLVTIKRNKSSGHDDHKNNKKDENLAMRDKVRMHPGCSNRKGEEMLHGGEEMDICESKKHNEVLLMGTKRKGMDGEYEVESGVEKGSGPILRDGMSCTAEYREARFIIGPNR